MTHLEITRCSPTELPNRGTERFISYNHVIENCEMRMRPPCELVVKLVLPAFRSLVAKDLIEKYNFSQVTAAKKLGTTQATISYYLDSKRGEKQMKQLEAMSSVRSMANHVAKGIANQSLSSFDAMLKFCELCKALRTKDLVCAMHRGFITIPKVCDVCAQAS